MKNRLGWYMRAKRLRLGLTAEALARQLGYRSMKKGVRRILRLERDGHGSDILIANVTEALGIAFSVVLKLQKRDAASSPLAYAFYQFATDDLDDTSLTDASSCRR